MKSTPGFAVLALFAVSVSAGCMWGMINADGWALRITLAGFALTTAFLLGLGVGERSNAAFCEQVICANQELNSEIQRLRDRDTPNQSVDDNSEWDSDRTGERQGSQRQG